MLICRNTKEKDILWRADLLSGRLSFSGLEQNPVDTDQNILRHHYVCVGGEGGGVGIPFYSMEFAITFSPW